MKKQPKKFPKDELLLKLSIQHAQRIVFSEMTRLNNLLESQGELSPEQLVQLTTLIKCCNDMKRTENAIDKGRDNTTLFKDEGELADIIHQPNDFMDNQPIDQHNQLDDIQFAHSLHEETFDPDE